MSKRSRLGVFWMLLYMLFLVSMVFASKRNIVIDALDFAFKEQLLFWLPITWLAFSFICKMEMAQKNFEKEVTTVSTILWLLCLLGATTIVSINVSPKIPTIAIVFWLLFFIGSGLTDLIDAIRMQTKNAPVKI